MKKFFIACVIIISLFVIYQIVFYRLGLFIDFQPNKEPTTFVKAENKKIYLNQGNGYKEFEIKGVDMGAGIPAHYATDYAIDKETYMRWFKQIQEMGANTIRVYTILNEDFYDAFYEYNSNNAEPLYLIHGLWVDDYVQFSSKDAFDDEFLGKMLTDSKILVDIIHGKRYVAENDDYANGNYKKDISKWTIGYILGVEWEDVTVAYTNNMHKEENSYHGKYMYTTEEATPFEAILAQVGDNIIEYESKKYKEQRLVAFSNWPTTDPIEYSDNVMRFFEKIAKVDVEHIKLTNEVISGTFASYHVYPYYPDYLSYDGYIEECVDKNGNINTYYSYLKTLVEHHQCPVVISEYGVPSSRGMAQRDKNTGRNQGGMSETQQGEAIIQCYNDIKDAGCAGGIIFTWQDEWFKRTWNTLNAVDLTKTPYWSDYQTNEQYFGLLSFDPGTEKSVCYVDGDVSEWKDEDLVSENDNMTVSMKYDEKFIYFMVNKKDYKDTETIYIPIDTTPKTGSNYCSNYDIKFDKNADFIIVINGKDNSRVAVQERYELIRAMSNREVNGVSAYQEVPDKNTDVFKPIKLMLRTTALLETGHNTNLADTFEAGKLTYGNANPDAEDFNSLADFCINGDNIEIKLPWQLLNFSNPSEMKIHDDYYENYGVEEIQIDKISVGIGTDKNKDQRIEMKDFALEGWGNNVTYHERLKKSYYMIQEVWTKE